MASRMSKKTTSKKKSVHPGGDIRDRILDSALRVAEQMPWDSVSLSDIAQEAGLSLSDLRESCEDKADILGLYGRRVDRRTLAGVSSPDMSSPEKDRLFDVLMTRFDVLNEDRNALVSILGSFLRDPKQAVISLPHLARSMMWMAESAGLSTDGLGGALRILGLSAVYLNVLRTWMQDNSADLSMTMSALDKNLDRLEQIAGLLPL